MDKIEKLCENERIVYERIDDENVCKKRYTKEGELRKEKVINVRKIRHSRRRYRNTQIFFEDMIAYHGYHQLIKIRLVEEINMNDWIIKQKELLELCKLEQSILTDGKISPSKDGFFVAEQDKERVSELAKLQEKYNYGWYIAEGNAGQQIKNINKFKEYIIDH